MLNAAARRRGFTVIELLVTMSVMALLMAAAAPAVSNWVANAQVRSVAESLQNGLRLAQTEATRQNRQTVFALTNDQPSLHATTTASGSNWFVRALPTQGEDDSNYYVQGGNFATQNGVTIAGQAQVCFNSVGRQITSTATPSGFTVNCTAPTAADNVSSYNVSKAGSDRALRVQVGFGGRIRLCDPAKTLAVATPDGCCPATPVSMSAPPKC